MLRFNIHRIVMVICLFFLSQICFGLPFNITPKAGTSLPQFVTVGDSAIAYYTVQNNTTIERSNNFVKYLPPNVSQVTTDVTYPDTCDIGFTLAARGNAGDSCTLQLNITWAVNALDPDPYHHLFVCFPLGTSCAGTRFPLNLSISFSLPPPPIVLDSISVIPANFAIGVGNSRQFIALGRYSDNSIQNITSSVSWASSDTSKATISSTGLVTGVAVGPTTISATLGLISGSTTVTVKAAVAYIVNQNDNSVSLCSVNSTTGVLSGCADAGASGLDSPRRIAVNPAHTFAYITNFTNNTVSLCAMNPATGELSSCANSGGTGFSGPRGIILNTLGTRAYIANFSTNTISLCTVNTNTGALSGCINSGATGLSRPIEAALNNLGSRAYVANEGDGVTLCSVNSSTGMLSGCADSGGRGFFGPQGIVLTAIRAYVTNVYGDDVTVCSINQLTGTLSGCADSGTGLDEPSGIALSLSIQFAYIANFASNTVSVCAINSSTGALSGCTSTGSGFIGPRGVVIAIVG